MNQVGRFPAALLRVVAARWPAEIRERMLQEWLAELAMLRAQSDGRGQSARFLISLLLSALWRHDDDLPSPVGAIPVLPTSALLSGGVVLSAMPLLLTAGLWSARADPTLLDGNLQVVILLPVTILTGLSLGWWLGNRSPAAPNERFGAATSAVLAAACLTVTFLIRAVGWERRQDAEFGALTGTLLAVLLWGPAIARLGVLTVRWSVNGRRWRVRLAAPALSAVAAMAAAAVGALPMLVPALGQGGFRFAVSLLTAPANRAHTVPTDYPYPFYRVVDWLPVLLGSGILVLAYGVRTAHRSSDRPAAGGSEPVPARVTAAGAAAVVVGALAWAYATTLEPLMQAMNDTYDQRYGNWLIDTSSFIGMHDLRWGAILLAVLGFVVVTAQHARPGIAGGVLAAALLALDGFADRHPENFLAGPRFLLVGAGAAILLAWWVSGTVQESVPATASRRRVMVPAVLAASALPYLYLQLPEPVDVPYLPVAYLVVVVVLPAAGGALAAFCATGALWMRVALPVPAVLFGIAVLIGIPGVTGVGVLLGLPVIVLWQLAILAIAMPRVARLFRLGFRARLGWSVARWIAVLVAVPALPLISLFLLYPLNALISKISTGGTGFDDGAVYQPGIIAVLFLAGQWAATGTASTPVVAGPAVDLNRQAETPV